MSEPKSDAEYGEHEIWCDCVNGISKRCNCLVGTYIEKIEDLQSKLDIYEKALGELSEPCTRQDYTIGTLDKIVTDIARQALDDAKKVEVESE